MSNLTIQENQIQSTTTTDIPKVINSVEKLPFIKQAPKPVNTPEGIFLSLL